MNKEDLIKGEYYYAEWDYKNNRKSAIVKLLGLDFITLTNLPVKCLLVNDSRYLNNHTFGLTTSQNVRLATPEEKHWLNKCIELGIFITKEEAMKSFMPEYVECINNNHSNSETIGKIYKTSELPNWVKGWNLDSYWKKYIINYKPSTKEVYEAQFKDTFVLPENWHIIIINDNKEVLGKWFERNTNRHINDVKVGYLVGKVKWNNGRIEISRNPFNIINASGVYGYSFGIEITFEQFKKYVLKEDIQDKQEFTDTMIIERKFSLLNIEEALLKDYGKEDVKDIIKTLNKHLK